MTSLQTNAQLKSARLSRLRPWRLSLLCLSLQKQLPKMVYIAEVCTGANSTLAQAAKRHGVRYRGFGLFNNHDMNTAEGFAQVKKILLKRVPTVTVMSPQCTAYSQAQNGNKRTQRRMLKQKRSRDAKTFNNTFLLATALRRQGRNSFYTLLLFSGVILC